MLGDGRPAENLTSFTEKAGAPGTRAPGGTDEAERPGEEDLERRSRPSSEWRHSVNQTRTPQNVPSEARFEQAAHERPADPEDRRAPEIVLWCQDGGPQHFESPPVLLGHLLTRFDGTAESACGIVPHAFL